MSNPSLFRALHFINLDSASPCVAANAVFFKEGKNEDKKYLSNFIWNYAFLWL